VELQHRLGMIIWQASNRMQLTATFFLRGEFPSRVALITHALCRRVDLSEHGAIMRIGEGVRHITAVPPFIAGTDDDS
jgi:hypothetical protein